MQGWLPKPLQNWEIAWDTTDGLAFFEEKANTFGLAVKIYFYN